MKRLIFASLLLASIAPLYAQDPFILMMFGVPPWRDPVTYGWTQPRGMTLLRYTTDSTGKVILIDTPSNTRPVNSGEPVVAVVPGAASSQSTASGGTGGPLSAGVAISPFDTLFALTDSGKVQQLDISGTGTVTRSLPTNQSLKVGVVSPRNQFLYAVSTGTSAGFQPNVQIVDLTTFLNAGSIPLPTTSIPSAVALTPDGKYLYVAGALRGQTFTDPSGVDCHIIDTTTRAVVTTLRFEGNLQRPEILMSPDGGRVFLTVGTGVAVIDVGTQTLSHTIPQVSNFGTLHIAIHPSGTSLFVAPVAGNVDVYDLATSTRKQSIAVPELTTMAMAVTAGGGYLVIDHVVTDPNTGTNDFPSVEYIDVASGKIVVTKPYTGSRDTPLTVGQMLPTIVLP